VVRFAGDLLALGQDGFHVVERDRGCRAFVTLDLAGDQLAAEFVVFVVQVVPLRLADLLDHHLLGSLRADALGHLLGRKCFSAVGRGNGAGAAVNRHHDVFLFAKVLLGGGDQGRFDALEDDLLFDILVAVDRVYDP
jgi:hypothetical protein